MQYKRLMGIDYGDKRIGIAFSDLMQIIASPFEIYKTVDFNKDVNYICNLAKEQSVEKIIFGLPLQMDGEEGERALITRNFANYVANQSGIEVIFQDERLSSVEADEILAEANISWKERKNLIDKLSACIILESYMNKRGKNGKRN